MKISQNAIDNTRQSFDSWSWFSPSKLLSKYSSTKPVNFFDKIGVRILSRKDIPNWVHKKCLDVLRVKELNGWFQGKRIIFGFGHPKEFVPNEPQFMIATKGDKSVAIVLDREAGKDEKGFIIAVFNNKTHEELSLSMKVTKITPEPIWKTELVFE